MRLQTIRAGSGPSRTRTNSRKRIRSAIDTLCFSSKMAQMRCSTTLNWRSIPDLRNYYLGQARRGVLAVDCLPTRFTFFDCRFTDSSKLGSSLLSSARLVGCFLPSAGLLSLGCYHFFLVVILLHG